jgi:hypothetical protein
LIFICPSDLRPHDPASEPGPVGQSRLRRGYETTKSSSFDVHHRKASVKCFDRALFQESLVIIQNLIPSLPIRPSLPIASAKSIYVSYFRRVSHCEQICKLSCQSCGDTFSRPLFLAIPFATTIRVPNHVSSIAVAPASFRFLTKASCISDAVEGSIETLSWEI